MATYTSEKTKTEKPLTWQKLVRAEPRLGELLAHARSTERELWATREDGEIRLQVYGSVPVYLNVIKPSLEYLVGCGRRRGPELLQTHEAYDLAVKKLHAALPYDFSQDEIDEARERAYEAELDEGEEMALAGPEAT